MISKKTLKILLICGITLSIVGTLSSTVSNYLRPYHKSTDIHINKEEFLTSETIVDELKDNLMLNILDIYMTSNATIDKSPLNFSWFEKIKEIKFHGRVMYSIDIDKINKDMVKVDGNNITIYMSNPMMNCEIFQDQTEFKSIKGFLTLTDVECTPEEMLSLEQKAKNNMLSEANEYENINAAREKVNSKIEFLISTLTKENYSVKVIWC